MKWFDERKTGGARDKFHDRAKIGHMLDVGSFQCGKWSFWPSWLKWDSCRDWIWTRLAYGIKLFLCLQLLAWCCNCSQVQSAIAVRSFFMHKCLVKACPTSAKPALQADTKRMYDEALVTRVRRLLAPGEPGYTYIECLQSQDGFKPDTTWTIAQRRQRNID